MIFLKRFVWLNHITRQYWTSKKLRNCESNTNSMQFKKMFLNKFDKWRPGSPHCLSEKIPIFT